MKAKPEPPLHLDMDFGEALARFVQTKPEEVEPPKGKSPKVTKAATRLTSLKHDVQEEKNNKRAGNT